MQLSSLLASAGLTGLTAAQNSANFSLVLNTTLNSTSNTTGSWNVPIDTGACCPPAEAFHITTTIGWSGSSFRGKDESLHSILEEHIHIYLERSHIILQRQRTHLLHAMPLQEDSIMSQTAPKSESKIRTNFIHVTALYIMQDGILWVLDTREPTISESQASSMPSLRRRTRACGDQSFERLDFAKHISFRQMYNTQIRW